MAVALATLPPTVTAQTSQTLRSGFRAARKPPNAAAVSAGTGGNRFSMAAMAAIAR